MMKKLLSSVSFILVLLPSLYSQHLAGYLGKHLTLYGDVKSFLRTKPSAKEDQLPFNFKVGGGVDVILGRRFSISLDYEMFKTGFDTKLPYLHEGYSGYDEVDYETVTLGCQTHTYGLLFQFFNGNKGHLAPYGSYQVVGVKLLSITEKDYRGTFADYAHRHGMNLEDPQISTYAYGATYGFGKKWLYLDHLIVDFRIQVCLVVDKKFKTPLLYSDSKESSSSYSYSYYNSSEPINTDFTLTVEQDMLKRVANHSFVDLSLGVGWLLF